MSTELPHYTEWLEMVAAIIEQEKGIPYAEALKLVREAEERAVRDGQVIDVNGVRWAVRPDTLALALAEGDELAADRLEAALARLVREGKETG